MTTNAFLRFDPGTIGIPAGQWDAFAAENGLVRCPFRSRHDSGIWVRGEVRAEPLPPSETVPHGLDVSTFFCGADTPLAARIAFAAWLRWGGSLEMADEMRAILDTRPPDGMDFPEQRERLVA